MAGTSRVGGLRRDLVNALTAVVLAASGAGCGGGGGESPTSPSPTPQALRGQALDATGDARADASLRVPPDLTEATLTTTNGVVSIRVRFAPGTFDRSTLSTQLDFDTDQNTATGLPGIGAQGPDGGVIGTDFFINVEPAETYVADCRTPQQGQCRRGATAPASSTQFVADGFDLTVSLSLLGGDDGRMSFKVLVAGIVGVGSQATFTPDLDVMPDVGRPATRVE